jgi:hypothetical protein
VLKLSGLSFSILSTTLTFVIIYKGTDSWSTVMQLLLPWLYVSDDKLVLVDRVFEAIASHIPDMCCLVASLLRLPTFGSTPHSFLCNENKAKNRFMGFITVVLLSQLSLFGVFMRFVVGLAAG